MHYIYLNLIYSIHRQRDNEGRQINFTAAAATATAAATAAAAAAVVTAPPSSTAATAAAAAATAAAAAAAIYGHERKLGQFNLGISGCLSVSVSKIRRD